MFGSKNPNQPKKNGCQFTPKYSQVGRWRGSLQSSCRVLVEAEASLPGRQTRWWLERRVGRLRGVRRACRCWAHTVKLRSCRVFVPGKLLAEIWP